MKKAMYVILLLSLAISAKAADDPSQLADEAVRANPGIEAMRARTAELSHLASVAGTWKDPMLGIEYSNAPVDSLALDKTPMSGIEFKLAQNLPERGWSKASREVAELRVATSEHSTAEAELQLRLGVETLYWKLTLSNLLQRITQDHIDRTEELLRAVRARYEVGKAGQNALLRLEVLRDRLKDDLGDFRSAQRDLSAGLARTLARTPDSQFDTSHQIEPLALEGTASAWTELALRHRPELARIREQVKLERKAAELARITTRPDVDVWVKYRVRDVNMPDQEDADFVSAGFSIPIPWGSRKRGLGEEAAHLESERGAVSQLAAAVDAIEADLVSIEADWSRAHEKALTYRDKLLPGARTTLETSLSEFSVGAADFASLYEAEVELLTLEKAYLTACVQTHLQRVAANATVGVATLGELP